MFQFVFTINCFFFGLIWVFCAILGSTYVFSWDPECLWFMTNLNIAQICFVIENSQKWYILDQHWWLVCFVYQKSIHICFLLGPRIFVIYYKSKYSLDMFYDWKSSEMVHPRSALMTGMFFCILYMFYLPKEHLHMFFHIKILLLKLHFTRIFQLW